MTMQYFHAPLAKDAQYIIYQMPISAKAARDILFVGKDTKVYPEDYVAVARGEFNKDASPSYIIDELFEIYNHQHEELEYTTLKHYAGNSMSSGDVIELRYPNGVVQSWLCCSIGWHLLKEAHFRQ